MDGYKEFQGKDLDTAIQDACLYFNVPREKLEIDILQDAKTGIFGIVGARKARIRARRVHLRDTVQNVLGEINAHRPSGRTDAPFAEPGQRAQSRSRNVQSQSKGATRQQPGARETDGTDTRTRPAANSAAKDRENQTRRRSRQERDTDAAEKPRGRGEHRGRTSPPVADRADVRETARPIEEIDVQQAVRCAEESVALLLRPLMDEPPIAACQMKDGVLSCVVRNLGDASTILVGQDGSTLAAVQYLAGRLVSSRLKTAVRVSLDVDNFRQRQEKELREMALSLAARALQTGKVQSTRPLSPYQRRLVHLILKEVEGIQGRSTGEGGHRRILISRRKSYRRQETEAGAHPDANGTAVAGES